MGDSEAIVTENIDFLVSAELTVNGPEVFEVDSLSRSNTDNKRKDSVTWHNAHRVYCKYCSNNSGRNNKMDSICFDCLGALFTWQAKG